MESFQTKQTILRPEVRTSWLNANSAKHLEQELASLPLRLSTIATSVLTDDLTRNADGTDPYHLEPAT